MSDDTQRPARPAQHEEAGDEVEGHRHHRLGANDEVTDEAQKDDENEVEAHRHHRLAKHKLQ
jgi:hypothetical protein